MVQHPHQPQQKDPNMGPVGQQPPRLGIPARLGHLRQPDGGVDGESLMGERLDGEAVSYGEEEPPEVLDAHGCGLGGGLCGGVVCFYSQFNITVYTVITSPIRWLA